MLFYLLSEVRVRLEDPKFDFFGPTTIYHVEIEAYDDMFKSERKNLTVEITWVNKPPYFWNDQTDYISSISENEVCVDHKPMVAEFC